MILTKSLMIFLQIVPFMLQFYGWAAEKLPDMKKLPVELAQAVPFLYAAQEDRKAEVRQKAQEATLAFMIHLGYDRMFKMAGKLKVWPLMSETKGKLEEY